MTTKSCPSRSITFRLSSSAITRRSGIWPGHRPGIGKTIQERSDAKEMVAVTVGDINRCQVLAARRDPIYEDVRLLDGDKGVDENGDNISCFGPEPSRCRPWECRASRTHLSSA